MTDIATDEFGAFDIPNQEESVDMHDDSVSNNDEDAISSITMSIIDYNRISEIANDSIVFRGKTLNEWSAMIAIPSLTRSPSIEEIEEYNRKFIEISEIIRVNLSYAQSSMDFAKIEFSKRATIAREQIISEIRREGRRIPGKDTLEYMIKDRSQDEYMAYKIAEMMYTFWKNQYDMLKLFDNRLTGLSVLKNVESKI